MFFLLDIPMTAFLTIFRRFPKILQNLSGHTNVAEHFLKLSEDYQRLSKISKFAEDFRGRLEEVSMKNNLRDRLDISEIIDIFASEDQ